MIDNLADRRSSRYIHALACCGCLFLGILGTYIYLENKQDSVDYEALTIGIEEVRGKYQTLGDYAFLLHSVANSLESCNEKGGCASTEIETLELAISEIDRDKIQTLLHKNQKRNGRF